MIGYLPKPKRAAPYTNR